MRRGRLTVLVAVVSVLLSVLLAVPVNVATGGGCPARSTASPGSPGRRSGCSQRSASGWRGPRGLGGHGA